MENNSFYQHLLADIAKRSHPKRQTKTVLDEVVCLETNSDSLIVISQTMGLIESRILENKLLGKIMKASEGDIFFLKEQFGEEAVIMGMEIVEAYTSLHRLVTKLKKEN